MLKIKRIYNGIADDDGYRVLVDRLWPRGLSKQEAGVDKWFKEIAPSPSLRDWFGHKPERFKEFSERYREELRDNPALKDLSDMIANRDNVTLLYAAKNTEHNHAVVLFEFLDT